MSDARGQCSPRRQIATGWRRYSRSDLVPFVEPGRPSSVAVQRLLPAVPQSCLMTRRESKRGDPRVPEVGVVRLVILAGIPKRTVIHRVDTQDNYVAPGPA